MLFRSPSAAKVLTYSQIAASNVVPAEQVRAGMRMDPSTGKRIVRLFISYAHIDGFVESLVEGLRTRFSASKNFGFELWPDRDILVGERWHDRIQEAVRTCDYGLLLVSPAFLGSQYVSREELPQLLDRCLPPGP